MFDRLTDAHRAMLKTLPLLHGRMLLDLVQELVCIGHALGEFEAKRMVVRETHSSVDATAITRAHSAWLHDINE